MRPFAFRAVAALELRRRQHEESLRRIAAARAAVIASQTAVDTARQELAEAKRGAADANMNAGDAHQFSWHQNWIVTRSKHVESNRDTLRARQIDERGAASEEHVSRRKLRSLERLRDRALAAYVRTGRRDDQRQSDLFGTSQYAARKRSSEGGEE